MFLALSTTSPSAQCEHTEILAVGPVLGLRIFAAEAPRNHSSGFQEYCHQASVHHAGSPEAGRERNEGGKINFDSDKEEKTKNHFFEKYLAYQSVFFLFVF